MDKRPNKAWTRIVQILPSFSRKDAIGEEVVLMDELFQSWGYGSAIMDAKSLRSSFEKPTTQTLIVYHMSIGSQLPYVLQRWGCEILVRFHNITPVSYFLPYSSEESTIQACSLGWLQMPLIARLGSYFLPVSSYNAESLKKFGVSSYQVLPILRRYDFFTEKKAVLSSVTQFLFVGRLSPNKCQEDVIALFSLYRECVDKKARLVLVGGTFSFFYKKNLMTLGQKLGLRVGLDLENKESYDLIFVDRLSDDLLAALYKESTVFLSMSEHEGFCVPLVEAMASGLPVVAHRSSAIPETLGDAGVLIEKEHMSGSLETLTRVVKDQGLRATLKEAGLKRVQELSFASVSNQLANILSTLKTDDPVPPNQ